jgi:pimeloyl-[acyl-carrier protein] methyl ester esterase
MSYHLPAENTLCPARRAFNAALFDLDEEGRHRMGYLERGEGRRVYFEDHQGPGRPFLLIHGWAMSGRAWDTTLAALRRRGHRVATFDQRGCGLSDKDFADTSVAASIGDAVALVEHLGLFGVIVNGWSLGGAVATGAAHALGTRCGGLILTCGASPRFTCSDDFPHGATTDEIGALIGSMAADRASFFKGVSQAVCARPVGQAVEDWLWSMFMQAGPAADDSLLDLAKVDQRAMLSGLGAPVLSIVGGADTFVPAEIGEAAADMARDGTAVRFEGCGHAPFLEDFPGYMDAISAFADRLDREARA